MAFATIAGNTVAGTNANGLYAFTANSTLSAATLLAEFLDMLQSARYETLAGVLSGGVCTVSNLTVTVPANTIFVAGGMVWTNSGAETKAVTDDATTYVWARCDGELDITSSTTPPTGFENGKACILTRAVAVSGTATIDNDYQQRARTADHTNRVIGENAKVFAPVMDTIPSGFVGVIPSGSQYNIFGTLTNAGKITCSGKIRIEG